MIPEKKAVMKCSLLTRTLASDKNLPQQKEASTFENPLAINGVCVNWLCNLSSLLQMQNIDV
jgi:hypothetical protein